MNWRFGEAALTILIIGTGVVCADVIRLFLGFLYGVMVGLEVVLYQWWYS
jgi:hypothetical protein